MQQLTPDTVLQAGRYKIISTLGQGGFGITYLAVQSVLERKVAIKEFFMKGLCERDGSTSHVTLGTEASRETVNRFREKFLKEARNIARLNHPNIVRIIDVFEENGTAYYVMEYAENGSLADKVKREGYLSEKVARRYILQISEALDYIHLQKMNHLDVKPANIMLNEKDEAVLIDFGLAKQYDAATGSQTSTTPVGISEGYAPMEQYMQGGVGTFSPETDIYALGATFYKLLTGTTPPDASFVSNEGLPLDKLKTKGVSNEAISVITQSMQARRKDRPKSVRCFIDSLNSDNQDAVNLNDVNTSTKPVLNQDDESTMLVPDTQGSVAESVNLEPDDSKWFIVIVAIVVIVAGIAFGVHSGNETHVEEVVVSSQTATANGMSFTVNGVSFNMVKVEGGTFTMGCTGEQGTYDPLLDEKPAHQVTLSSYMIGETEVTQELWQAVMGSNPSDRKVNNLPVEQVSWKECQEFIRKLNNLTGQNFRLPTEAEWEYASRGGKKSQHYKYSGSNNIGSVAWYEDNSGSQTHPVKTKQPNELGLYDMSGNVDEWCQDWKGSYTSNAQTNPTGSTSGSYRVIRGGSWSYGAGYCRVSNRSADAPSIRNGGHGLRLSL